jgi:thioredoxin-like negative regulator of GroEL
MNKVTTNELLSKWFVNNNGKWNYKGTKPCIIQFSADWCQPCKPQEAILTEMKKEYGDVEFLKVNVEEEYELAEIFNIKNLPTIFVCGKETKQFSGLTQKSKIEDVLKNQLEVIA